MIESAYAKTEAGTPLRFSGSETGESEAVATGFVIDGRGSAGSEEAGRSLENLGLALRSQCDRHGVAIRDAGPCVLCLEEAWKAARGVVYRAMSVREIMSR